MTEEQELFCIDTFRSAASYGGLSYADLRNTLNDPRATVLPMSLRAAFRHLQGTDFSLALIDADHSYAVAVEDRCLAVALAARGSTLLCHDVDEDLFPGVVAALESLTSRQILETGPKIGTLGSYTVRARPTWLLDPGVFRDEELPG